MAELNERGCGFYSGVGNLLTFVSFYDTNMGVQVICGVGYSLENMVSQTKKYICVCGSCHPTDPSFCCQNYSLPSKFHIVLNLQLFYGCPELTQFSCTR